MKNITKQQSTAGFTVVELLVTLFIAAAFLMSGYQLYDVIMKDGGDARATARASNVAYDYLQRYKPNATNPCTALTPVTNQTLTDDIIANATVSVTISCPYSTPTIPTTTTPSISKVLVTIKYNTPQQTLNIATYVKP